MQRVKFIRRFLAIVCTVVCILGNKYAFNSRKPRVQQSSENNHFILNSTENRLVDMVEANYKVLYLNQEPNREHLHILFFNPPSWINLDIDTEYLQRNCYYDNCIFTTKVENISSMSAVVFSTQNFISNRDSEIFHRERSADQVWIFFRLEAPPFGHFTWYKNPIWKNSMNWSWGYWLDSDIFKPMQKLTTRKEMLHKDYWSIFHSKVKMAAWVVSHCGALSRRDEYVSILKRYGVEVDIFGRCSENKTMVGRSYIKNKINTEYKFYLAFENNLCKDYITEKFYSYLHLDVVLVVRGGINYSHHFNDKAFIDAADFPTIKSLAEYMLKVSNNETLYSEYLRNKDKYNIAGSKTESMRESQCQLCGKLNNKNRFRKVYPDIDAYIHNNSCYNPDDI